MLANNYKGRVDFEGPVYIQPKLDGVRALFRVDKKRLVSIDSRNGNPFGHLVNVFSDSVAELMKKIDGDLGGDIEFLGGDIEFLDGELYVHGKSFQDLVSMVRNPERIDDGLEFHIFDLVTKKKIGFAERWGILSRAFAQLTLKKSREKLKLVNTTISRDIEGHLARAELEGYEGIMIRDGVTPYEMGKRSKSLLKYKRFSTDEFEIVGVREAQGKDRGTPVFECRTLGGSVFSARPKGTLEERKMMMTSVKVGMMMTVQHQGFSRDGVPRFPVAIVVRDYE